MKKNKEVAVLSNNLVSRGYSRRDAWQIAWNFIKSHSTRLVAFERAKTREVVKRVVFSNLSDHYDFVGGRKSNAEILVMGDCAKYIAQEPNWVISARKELILES